MKLVHTITTYLASVCLIVAATACTDEEQDSLSLALTEENITFLGSVEENRETASRASTPMNETSANYGDIYIYQQVDNDTHIGIYTVTSGNQGRLVTKENGTPLKWEGVNAVHTFYAWTQPNVTDETSQITGGVAMDEKQENEAPTGTVTFGTQKETNLEKFIVAQVGQLTYSAQNQYVGLHFYHPVGKIQLDSITHIRSDGSKEDIQQAIITFPNLPKSAVFSPLNAKDSPYTDVLTENEEKGVTWEWDKGTRGGDTQLYVHPFTFREDGKEEYEQPGYFTIEINVTSSSGSSTTTKKIYSGTLAASNDPTELRGNELMHIGMQVADGNVTGLYSHIVDWNTAPAQTVPQHRVPGIYTQEDAEALLEALQNEEEIPAYLVDIEGESQTIRFFTHVDWSNATSDIIIPEDYTLDGQGYYLKPDDITLYGKIENLYKQDGTQYKATEKPEEPDGGNTGDSGDEGNEGENNTGEDTTGSNTEDGTNP